MFAHSKDKPMKNKLKYGIASIAFGIALGVGSVTLLPAEAQAQAVADAPTVQIKTGKGSFVKLTKNASAVFVADPEIADVELKFANMLYVFGVKPGSTTVHVLDDAGNIITTRTVQVIANIQELQTSLNELLPKSSVTVQPVNDSYVLTGNVRTSSEAEMAIRLAKTFVAEDKVVNMISVSETNQVTLRVRVAEVQKSITQQFGISPRSSGRNNRFNWGTFGQKGLALPGDVEALSQGQFNGFGVGQDTFTLLGGFVDGKNAIEFVVEALESHGLLTTLAEPNLTAISGETASFLAGGEFPILVRSGTGADAETTVEYKQFGVALNFTPVILNDNRIRLHVNPVVSELSQSNSVTLNGFTIPGLTTRKVDTTVELGDGQSLSIAGLFQNTLRENIDKFPWLGDLPVLGNLFKSRSYASNDSELLVMVTPFLTEPVNDADIAMPVDFATRPTDKDRVLYNQTAQTTLQPTTVPALQGKLIGPAGFMME